MNFSFEDTRNIIRLNPVHVEMQKVVIGAMGRDRVPVKPTPPWTFGGKAISTGPFRLFRGCVEMAITQAVEAATGRERERLLSALHMVEGDDPAPVAKAVGISCEEYAVTMQHGNNGWRAYQDFIAPYEV